MPAVRRFKLKSDYKPAKVDYGKVPTKDLVVQPDQAMTTKEIVERFTRKLPVAVTQRKPIYVDQKEWDLEALARMDFGEKQEFSDMLKERAEEMARKLRAKQDEEAMTRKMQREAADQGSEADSDEAETDIDNLDNTMSVDTRQKDKQLRKKSKS